MSYERKLELLLDEIFDASGDMSIEEMAKRAGLALATVYRINNRETRFPRFKTVLGLAKAVGMDLQLVLTIARRQSA